MTSARILICSLLLCLLCGSAGAAEACGNISETNNGYFSLENTAVGMECTPTISGDADSVTVYLQVAGADNCSTTCLIYDTDGNFLTATEEKLLSAGDPYRWESFAVSSRFSVTAYTTYRIYVVSANGAWVSRIAYEQTTGKIIWLDMTYGSPPDPAEEPSSFTVFTPDMYFTYTMGAGADNKKTRIRVR